MGPTIQNTFNVEMMASLLTSGTVMTLKKGEVLFYDGDTCKDLYVVIDGMIGIFKGRDLLVPLTIVQKNGFLGEMAAITGNPRSASAVALMDAQLIVLPAASIDEKMKQLDPFFRMLVIKVIENLARTNLILLGKVIAGNVNRSHSSDLTDLLHQS